MTIDELRVHFVNLINSYVVDSVVKARLLALVERNDVPAKGILADLMPYLSGIVSDADARIIKDIAFNFC
ncbi:MAG: hypothetical protein LBE81_05955 [Azonexus sp.]|jgi:hypothetical protein|uniref:hypothetical protein n=1 Tax=Azonexus sp. TaxID=1872668 RepID=UPI002819D0EB|nr:hypothetical protein [Azonexus sp.]MDR0776166.1 hypothetical protein [Azonexus sp.]